MASSMCSEVTEECTRLVFKAVNENSVSLLKCARSKYGKIQFLTSLAKCNEEGETPLAIAMKMKHFPVIEELLEVIRNVDLRINKFLLISVVKQLPLHVPMEEVLDYLLERTYSHSWMDFMLEVFIESTAFTRQDKIIAFELIGAIKIFSGRNCDTRSSLDCWRRAIVLRFVPAVGAEHLPKAPAVCDVSAASYVVFGSSFEVMTIEELNLLEERTYFNSAELFIQALLVIQRISSQNNLGHPYWLYLNSLMMFAEGFEGRETERESKLYRINIYLLILEQLNGFDPKLFPRKTFDVFASAICHLSKLFYEIQDTPFDNPARDVLTFTNLLAPTECINRISKFLSNPVMISSVDFGNCSFAEIIYRFLVVLDAIFPQMSNQEKQKLEEYYVNYIENFFPHQSSTVLHVMFESDLFLDVNFEAINLLLKLGANPNAVDEHGRNPLHVLARKRSSLSSERAVPFFRALVEAGTHLDTATDDGKTVINIMKRNLIILKQSGGIPHPYFESLVNFQFPLSCYCARVIRRSGIAFNRLPSKLQAFVAMHSNVEGN